MKTLVTKSKHNLRPILLRHDINTEAYLHVKTLEITKRGVKVKGEYYCMHNNGRYKLSDVSEKIIPKEQIFALETQLQNPTSTNLLDIVSQRLSELMFATLQMEGKGNFDIEPSDWIEYVGE